jgi:Outer membrane protein beta-barrel domain
VARILIALAALVALPQAAGAQEHRVYAGGAFTFATQTHSDEQPLGGTTIGGSALFGVRASPRVSIEFEPSFGGTHSGEYDYRPFPSSLAHVVVSRRDASFPVQARFRFGVLEPVLGGGLVRATISRHATIAGVTYFDDGRSETDLGLIGGVDAALRLASHVDLVPTFRMLVVPRAGHSGEDPLGEQTSTGWFTFRYGVGARVAF